MSTTTQAAKATTTRATAIPALLPSPDDKASPGIFWAVRALNDDACVQALTAVRSALFRQMRYSSTLHVKEIAMTAAVLTAQDTRNESVARCCRNGGLLYAWRESRALVQALPASLQHGGAA